MAELLRRRKMQEGSGSNS